MKKIKVSEATNQQLDWLVAKCEGFKPDMEGGWHDDVGRVVIYRLHAPTVPGRYAGESTWQPTTDPAQMWPIIDREDIEVLRLADIVATEKHPTYRPGDRCECNIWPNDSDLISFCGPTSLVAAARCYVVSRLGEEVEVPEELT